MIDKYFDDARELKSLQNTKVIVITILINAFRKVPKGLKERLEELNIRLRNKTIQTITKLKSARIIRRVLEIWGDFLLSKLQLKLVWKTLKEKSNNT